MENVVTFGNLSPDGKLSNIRLIKQSTFGNCPFFIMIPDHYREDGSCKCNDPEHQKMMRKEWGYKKKDFIKVGVPVF
jgi:hypothetical protein